MMISVNEIYLICDTKNKTLDKSKIFVSDENLAHVPIVSNLEIPKTSNFIRLPNRKMFS